MLGADMVRTLLMLAAFLACAAASARQVSTTVLAGVPYLKVSEFAGALGTVPTVLGPSVVLRTGFGVATLFTGSSDYLWLPGGANEPFEGSLPVPVREQDGELWAPLELVDALGGSVSGVVAIMPDRSRLLLSELQPPAVAAVTPAAPAGSRSVELGHGVRALQLSVPGRSLLLADAGLLGLALPEQRAALDEFNKAAHGSRPLYFVFAADAESAFDASVRFSQEGLEETASFEGELVVLAGDPAAVGPDSPLSGLLLLPVTADLRRPLRVEWLEAGALFSFRR